MSCSTNSRGYRGVRVSGMRTASSFTVSSKDRARMGAISFLRRPGPAHRYPAVGWAAIRRRQ